MTTHVYRVTRVRTPASSPVAQLQAVDAEGHELRIELPTAAMRDTAPGHVLVLEWSVHVVPDLVSVAADAPQPSVANEIADGRTVDETFMDLMSKVRRSVSTSEPPNTRFTTPLAPMGEREIDVEFNTLLGGARRKG